MSKDEKKPQTKPAPKVADVVAVGVKRGPQGWVPLTVRLKVAEDGSVTDVAVEPGSPAPMPIALAQASLALRKMVL